MILKKWKQRCSLLASLSLLSGCELEPSNASEHDLGEPASALSVNQQALTGEAVYDATLKAPRCADVGPSCDAMGLVNGRGPVGPEPSQPNTINNSCADGTAGRYHVDETLDRLKVSTLDGGNLAPGKTVRVEATVWPYSNYATDRLHLYAASDATNPVWTHLATLTPSASGSQVLSTTFVLPNGSLQAVRGVFRYGSSAASPCGTGSYDDHDDLVFAVGSGGDITPPSVALIAPASGATLSGPVTVRATATDDVAVARVEFYAGSRLLGIDLAAPYELIWDTTTASNALHSLTAKAIDTNQNPAVSPAVSVTVSNSGNATHDPAFAAPSCASLSSRCDTVDLVLGRGNLSGGKEPNAPNTLHGSCADLDTGTFHVQESLDRLKVSTLDGTDLAAGKTVRVDATVWAGSNPSADGLDLFTAVDPVQPSWTYLTTLVPSASGQQVLSATYVLPESSLQAIRGVFRNGGSISPCASDQGQGDRDDLVFTVSAPPDTTPPSTFIATPIEGSTVRDTVSVQASASDNHSVRKVELYVNGALVGTDTSAPWGVPWNTRGLANGSTHALTVKAYDAAGNAGTSAPVSVIIGNDYTSPIVSITSPAAGTVSGVVTYAASASDNERVSSVTLYLNGAQLATFSSPPYSTSWNTYTVSNGTHTLVARAIDPSGNWSDSAVTVTVSNAGAAAYDPVLGAPRCSSVSDRCDTTTLVRGRGPVGPEQNQPNALQGSCADGTSGTYLQTDSIERLQIATLDGSPLEPGKYVQLTATAYLSVPGSNNNLFDVYYASDANNPAWTHVATLKPSASGETTLTATYVLPPGGLQAVRVHMAQRNLLAAPAPCSSGGVDEVDDLVFATRPSTDTTAPTTALTSPSAGTTLAGTVNLSATASDDRAVARVEFYDGSTLIGSDSTAPYELSWIATAASAGTHTLTSKAFDGTGNSTTSAPVTITLSTAGQAAYDSGLKAPKCGTVGSSCDTHSLVSGRANLGPEPNSPNTLGGSCSDGGMGTFHWSQSVDGIKVTTLDGTKLAAGKTVRVEIPVWGGPDHSRYELTVFSSPSASSPVWTHVATLKFTGQGRQILSTTYVLPAGKLQAVRAQIRYAYSASPPACDTWNSSENDRDDLAFSVQ
jgi:hypothetical protein